MEPVAYEKKRDIVLEAEVRKRVLANCSQNISQYLRSNLHSARNWEVFAQKFRGYGIQLPKDFMQCKLCEEPIGGHFFEEDKTIMICANNIPDKQFDQVATHELVHLFDDYRAEIDYNDPVHVACGEIRAINLSGECTPAKFWRMSGRAEKYQDCVFQKTVDTLVYQKDKFGLDQLNARKKVMEAWDICFNDLEPFTMYEYTRKLGGRAFQVKKCLGRLHLFDISTVHVPRVCEIAPACT